MSDQFLRLSLGLRIAVYSGPARRAAALAFLVSVLRRERRGGVYQLEDVVGQAHHCAADGVGCVVEDVEREET